MRVVFRILFILFFIFLLILCAGYFYGDNNAISKNGNDSNSDINNLQIQFLENSLVKDGDKVIASFRQNLEGGAIDNVPISHRIMEYEANCDESLGLINVRNYYFNKEKLIKTTNSPKGFRSLCADINGEYIYNKMCKIEYECRTIYPKARTLNKEDMMTIDEYFDATNRVLSSEFLSLNEHKEVAFSDKVVLTDDRLPMRNETAMTTLEIKFLFAAEDVKPREGCDPSDMALNGTLGCYMDIDKIKSLGG